LRYKERNVKAKDSLFILDCFVPRNDARRESPLGLKGGKFEIDRDGLKGAENFSVQKRT
jgi:hypothetical protein